MSVAYIRSAFRAGVGSHCVQTEVDVPDWNIRWIAHSRRHDRVCRMSIVRRRNTDGIGNLHRVSKIWLGVGPCWGAL